MPLSRMSSVKLWTLIHFSKIYLVIGVKVYVNNFVFNTQHGKLWWVQKQIHSYMKFSSKYKIIIALIWKIKSEIVDSRIKINNFPKAILSIWREKESIWCTECFCRCTYLRNLLSTLLLLQLISRWKFTFLSIKLYFVKF